MSIIDDLSELRTELIRSRGFIRAAETQLSKTLNILDAIEVEEPAEPIPEGPHPAVPHIDHDPVAPLDYLLNANAHPNELTLTYLGSIEGRGDQRISYTYHDPNTNELYTPVLLPDGRMGLWGVESIDGGTLFLSPTGPWLHIGEDARATISIEEGETQAETEGGTLYDYTITFSDWFNDGFIEISDWAQLTATITVHWFTVHAEIAGEAPPVPEAPGQPTFEPLDGGGARISWAPSEHADEYRVEWTGGNIFTMDTFVEIPDFEEFDWVCVYAFNETGGSGARCNTWEIV